MIGSSDSDSEDDKRVIRSAKDRRFDELQATCHEIRVSKPVSDCGVLKSLSACCSCMHLTISLSFTHQGSPCYLLTCLLAN